MLTVSGGLFMSGTAGQSQVPAPPYRETFGTQDAGATVTIVATGGLFRIPTA